MSNWKQLESLVAYLEESLKPKGFEVERNDKVYDADGHQMAEFDVIISGKFGSTKIRWLIECRDRPSSGPAPGSWIEQLVGRRSRFNFNKVTAVSTTGFATGVLDFAQKEGIELRTVKEISPEEFSDWVRVAPFTYNNFRYNLKHARLMVDPDLPQEDKSELLEILQSTESNRCILRIGNSDSYHALTMAFRTVVDQEKLFDDVLPNGASKDVRIHARYSDAANRYSIDISRKRIDILSILYIGELSIVSKENHIAFSGRYQSDLGDTVHSEVVSYEPMEMFGGQFSLEMHNIGETGETHVTLRKM